MHVEETANMDDERRSIRLNVINANGEHYETDATVGLTVERLKLMALTRFLDDPIVSVKTVHQFRLVSIDQNKALNDESSVSDERLVDGSALLLVARHGCSAKADESLADDMRSGSPTEDDIMNATIHLTEKNLDRKSIAISNTIDFQKELRKILISLIDYSERIVRTHPEVWPIFGGLAFDDRTYMDSAKASEDVGDGINKDILKQLTDMGFTSERAKRALKINNMSPVDAMDWLLAYESNSTSSSSSRFNADFEQSADETLDSPTEDKTRYSSATGVCPRVPIIIDCYRSFKRKQFKPNTKAVKGLCDMGFDENEVLDALCVHYNNEIAACEWLLNDRRPKLKDLQYGLSKQSAIYKAIISNPVIQLGIVKPRIFFAFLQLIEEPNSTGRWLSDSETSPILSQMFRIFHSEKHAIDLPDDTTMDESVNN